MAVVRPTAQLQDLESRINTFRRWPTSAPLTAERIARAGFFYTGNGTEVECFVCRKRISDWSAHDQAIARHKSLNPDCPFVKSRGRCSRPQPPRSFSRTLSSGSGSSRFSDSDSLSSSPPSPPGNILTTWMSAPRPSLSERDRQALKREDVRLATFTGRWTVDFIEPRDLAKAGFFFVGHEDQVQCAFCAGVIGHWETDDDPMEEHRRHFRICPFVREMDVGNVPAGSSEENETPSLNLPPPFPGGYDICERYYRSRSRPLTDNVSVLQRNIVSAQPSIESPGSLESLGINEHRGPEHPDKTTYEARLKTFSNWHYYDRQVPEKLAEAGFFYLGELDKVKCFHCDMGLCNWEPSDDPWFEHAKWSNKCIFVNQTRGEKFVKLVFEATKKKAKNDVSSARKLEEKLRQEMESPITKTALEVVEARKVRQAILNKIRTTGHGFTAPDSLIIAALEIPDEIAGTNEPLLSESSSLSVSIGVDEPPQPHRLVGSATSNIEDSLESVSSGGDTMTNSGLQSTRDVAPSSPLSAMETSQDVPPSPRSSSHDEAMEVGSIEKAIEERYKCKVCLDQRIEVIFLPCGHLASCSLCAPALANCPLCRTIIRGTARVFLP